jgi:hypothetical protein
LAGRELIMKDLNGVEINFDDEKLFPLEFMLPGKNPSEEKEIYVEYETKSPEEEVKEMAEFLHRLQSNNILD